MISHHSPIEIRDLLAFVAAHPSPSITPEHERNPNCNLRAANRKMNAARKKNGCCRKTKNTVLKYVGSDMGSRTRDQHPALRCHNIQWMLRQTDMIRCVKNSSSEQPLSLHPLSPYFFQERYQSTAASAAVHSPHARAKRHPHSASGFVHIGLALSSSKRKRMISAEQFGSAEFSRYTRRQAQADYQ